MGGATMDRRQAAQRLRGERRPSGASLVSGAPSTDGPRPARALATCALPRVRAKTPSTGIPFPLDAGTGSRQSTPPSCCAVPCSHSSAPRWAVASTSTQSSSSHTIPFLPGTLRAGPGRYRGHDLGP